jgi:hypothetical protein
MKTKTFTISYLIVFVFGGLILVLMSDDGQHYLSTSIISLIVFFISYIGLVFLICFILGSIIFGISTLFSSNGNFKSYVFYPTLIIMILLILGQLFSRFDSFSQNSNGNIISETNIDRKKLFSSDDYYHSIEDDFAVVFPSDPQIHTAENQMITAKTYQASEILDEGIIQYSITITFNKSGEPFAESESDKEKFLTDGLNEYMKSLKYEDNIRKDKYYKFLDKYTALNFFFLFTYEGIIFLNRGIFFLKDDKVYRISVSYSDSIKDIMNERYNKFVSTFTLIE